MYERKKFENGFEYLDIKNDVANAKIAFQGAHIFEYEREAEEPLLWVSEDSFFQEGKAIRGGIPVCWPRFGTLDKSMPAHGFSRTAMFEFVNAVEISETKTRVTFKLTDSEQSRKIWNFKFELEVIFNIGKELEIELKTKNCDVKDMTLTQALHSYFGVSHISNASVESLNKKPYFDALSEKSCVQEGAICFTEEIDRVYQEVDEEVVLKDKNRAISIKNSGSSSVVVWNPWIEKSKRLAGMKTEDYKEFVCIESANAFDDIRTLNSGQTHSLEATIGVTPL